MKRILLIWAIACTAIPGTAQNNQLPFRDLLASAVTDSQKLHIYRQIYAGFQNNSPDSIIYYLEPGLDLFTAHDYKKGRAPMMAMLSGIYGETGNMESAAKAAQGALNLYTELKDETGIAKIHNSIGVLEGRKGNFDIAVKHFMSALPYFESRNDTANIINTQIKLGTANSLAGNEAVSLDYYKKALALALQIPMTPNRSHLYNNIGAYYAQKHEFDKALPYLLKALETSERSEYAIARETALMNMGNYYAEMDDPVKALDYYNKALAMARTMNLKIEEARLLHSIGYIKGLQEKGNTAQLFTALQKAKELGNRELQVNILTDLARLADSGKKFEDEANYLKQAKTLRDSLFSLDKSKMIANLEARHELDKTNTQLQLLKISEQKNGEKKNFIIIIATVLSVALIAVLLFLLKGRRLNAKLKRREQELQNANNVKDRLFSIIGHDLKGPIGNIPMLLEIYKSSGTPDEEKQFILDSLEENSQASIETLDKLLNWGKSQIKGNTLSQTTFNVGEIIAQKLRLFRVPSKNKEISIINNIPDGVEVYADENHFKFIVRNLLSNAIKYTRTGGSIEIGALRDKKNPHYIVFSIKDNGIGIEPEMQKHIFELYNKSTIGTADELGNSIGLMLCKEFAKQNGGDIWLESIKGKGSIFYFTVIGHEETPLS